MNDFEQKLQRTWVQFLVDHNYREIAALAIDIDVSIKYKYEGEFDTIPIGVEFYIPTSLFGIINGNDHTKKVLERSILSVCNGYLYDDEPFNIFYRVKLIEVEEGWQDIIRSLIANSEHPNQGIVTEKMFLKSKKQPYIYNEIKFGSQAEIRIAQELESRGVLFLPLPLAVRSKTGNFYDDHREPDFLVCDDGVWGILEVSFHPDRFEKDAEKDVWFKEAGILCIQHYSAERCYQNATEVVNEFLSILAKHKR